MATLARRRADVPLDLAWPEALIQRNVRWAINMLRGCDQLVLSAGYSAYTLPREYVGGRAARHMAINYFGRLAVLRAAYGALVESAGVALFLTSTAASSGPPGLPCYAASLAACEAFVRSEGRRLRDRFKITALAPGWTNSPMTENLRADYREAAERWMPIGRFLEPEEVAVAGLRLLDRGEGGEVVQYLGHDLLTPGD